MSTHELARLTADVVAFAERGGVWHVLMIQRRWDPYRGQWALPGGHVDPGESFRDAALRELAEETGVAAAELHQVGIYDHPGRDPRGRYVNVAFAAVLPEAVPPRAGDDAEAARWRPLDAVLRGRRRLAFDHGDILADAVEVLTALQTAAEAPDGDREPGGGRA